MVTKRIWISRFVGRQGGRRRGRVYGLRSQSERDDVLKRWRIVSGVHAAAARPVRLVVD